MLRAIEGDQQRGLTILEDTKDFFESGLASETRVANILLQTGLDKSLLLVGQPGDGLRKVSNEPPHSNANNTSKGTLCNVQVSTAQISKRT